MAGKTPRARKNERQRMDIIAKHCGCLPCLLMGYSDVHTSIEHVTERGRRITQDHEQHRFTIGLCIWHHFGYRFNLPYKHKPNRQEMSGELGPSLIWGRRTFEEHFGDELHVLVPTQDFMLSLFDEQPWPEYAVPRNIAKTVRLHWISLNQNATATSQSGVRSASN